MTWGLVSVQHWNVSREVRKRLTRRQGEYLSFVRSKNFLVYADVLDMLELIAKRGGGVQTNGSTAVEYVTGL